MKLILATTMLLTSLIGLCFCIHSQNRGVVFTAIPFTAQFSGVMYWAYRKDTKIRTELIRIKKEHAFYKAQNQKIKEKKS